MNSINLCDNNSCTQCHACELTCPKHCISFIEGKDGFSVPVIDRSLCVECGLCMQACHQITHAKRKVKPKYTYAAWSLEDSVRTTSSSGGVFTEIARYVFAKGGVVFGAVMDNGMKVHHSMAENMNELLPMRGSKYVQSDLTGTYKAVKDQLKTGRMVLFTGTPCQVGGLHAFLKNDYDNLLTCDLVCHGVPSQKSFNTYCDRVGLTDKEVAEISFRYTKGWGLQMASRSHLVSPSKDGDYKWQNISPRKSYYLRAFTSGLMFNEACYACQYTTPERISDFTLADFWGIGAQIPFTHSSQKGVSLLLVNTAKAQQVLDGCPQLFVEERSLEEAVKGNHNLSKCSGRPALRDTYVADAEKMSLKNLFKKYNLQPSWKDYLRPIKRIINNKIK